VPARPLEVGISIIPDTASLDRSRELVRVADAGGLSRVGIQDHPYQHHFFDTWSLIPTLLAETKLSNRGIGFLVIQAYSIFNMPQMYALLIILFVIAIGANAFIGRVGGLADIKRS